MTKAEARRRLTPGTQFTAEFIGDNATRCQPGMKVTKREVVSHSPYQLVSRFLDGPRTRELIYLYWDNTTVAEENGAIIFTHDKHDEFLKVTI